MTFLALLSLASATPGFDATSPEATFTGTEVENLEGTVRLWSAIERFGDPDRSLFAAGEYNAVTAWPASAAWAPYIASCFGSSRPHTSKFLLHVGPSSAIASGTPILFVPGAADNGSRGFITMAWHQDLIGRPVYALTFAHPHGDAFEQAELIADAIARIRHRTGAAEVDVVAHSKGGISAAIYASNSGGAEWPDTAYESGGTAYRGDIRRLVLIATPIGGIDTAFRWPNANFLALDADEALTPSSWQTYYPYTVGNPYVTTDLSAQDFFTEEGDLFPGQRQLYARQDHELPGSLAFLGAYAVQQDWYTTYEGGYGYYSYSLGVDAVVDAGGGVLGALADNGLDPSVDLYVLAGNNPLMPNGSSDYAAELFGDSWAESGALTLRQWGDIISAAIGDGLVGVGIAEEEVQGIVAGDVILGEISGESDGLVFIESATAGERLTGRGATLVDTHIANLSHLDLLYASPITGELLIEAGAENDDNAWMIAFGQRYTEEDTIGIVEDWLADAPADTGGDTGSDTGGDSGDSGPAADEDSGLLGEDDFGTMPSELPEECGACNGAAPSPWGAGGLLFALGLIWRRRHD